MSVAELPALGSPSDERLSRPQARLVRRWVGLGIGLVLPLHVAAWIVASRIFNWNVISTARMANVSGLLILVILLFGPLAFRAWPISARQRGFVLVWFAVSPFFNATWQLPLILFKHSITTAPVTAANLPRYISWWGYGSIDSHYGIVSSFMVASEMGWLCAMTLGVAGLALLLRRGGRSAWLLLAISGALQAYNATFYVLENGVVDRFHNVATGTWMGPVLYFGFGALWPSAALVASVLCFRFLLTQPSNGSQRSGT